MGVGQSLKKKKYQVVWNRCIGRRRVYIIPTNNQIPFRSTIGCCRQLDLLFSWTVYPPAEEGRNFVNLGQGVEESGTKVTMNERSREPISSHLLSVQQRDREFVHVPIYRSTLVYPAFLETQRIIWRLSSDCGNVEIHSEPKSIQIPLMAESMLFSFSVCLYRAVLLPTEDSLSYLAPLYTIRILPLGSAESFSRKKKGRENEEQKKKSH